MIHRALDARRIALLKHELHQRSEGAVCGPRIVYLTKRRLLNHV